MDGSTSRDEFRNAKPPSLAKPSWNHPAHDNPLLRGARKLGKRRVTQRWRAHLQSLQTVDEGVRRMMRALRDHGELDNTLILFTSDNGLFRVWESGERVLFDRRRDPYQLNNLWVGRKDRRMYRPVMRELRWRMWRLVNCQADECRRRFGAVPRPRR